MPPKKKAARPAPPPPAMHSDYDTDNANLTDNQFRLAMAAHTQPTRSADELNMLVLRRWYPEIESILAIAPFATLYLFTPDTQQWTKCETEGVLFVVQLMAEDGYPRYRVIILNRKSMDNFELDLVTNDNIEITNDYVIVQVPDEDGSPQIYGIWIFSDNSSVPDVKEVITSTIVACAQRAEENAQHAASLQGYHGPTYEEAPEASWERPVELDAQPQPHQQQQSQQPQYGQQIDLSKLFSAQPAAPAMHQQQHQQHQHQHQQHQQPPPPTTMSHTHSHFPAASNYGAHTGHPHAHPPPQFQTHSDTEFFRQPPQQTAGASMPSSSSAQQSNALLGLFNSTPKLA